MAAAQHRAGCACTLLSLPSGALLTADGTNDDKIKLEGMPKDEKFEIPRAAQRSYSAARRTAAATAAAAAAWRPTAAAGAS